MTNYYSKKAILGALEGLGSSNRKDAACCVGFDGYIDELYHAVKFRDADHAASFFAGIEDFGNRISQAAGKSADIEILLSERKLGGNGPILSNALTLLETPVTCIGTLDSELQPNPFDKMPDICLRLSFGQASKTVALEFEDGKIMLGDLCGNGLSWEEIKSRVGLHALQRACQESRLIAIVNWSGLSCRKDILKGYLREVYSTLPQSLRAEKIFFFDLADPTALGNSMDVILQCIRAYSHEAKVILGLNENEARRIGQALLCGGQDLMETGRKILRHLNLMQVIIHTNRQAMAFSQKGTGRYGGMYVEHPVISTGAGDHFNAGYIWGILHGLGLEESLALGQGDASYYLSTGTTPNREQLAAFLQKQLDFEKGACTE